MVNVRVSIQDMIVWDSGWWKVGRRCQENHGVELALALKVMVSNNSQKQFHDDAIAKLNRE